MPRSKQPATAAAPAPVAPAPAPRRRGRQATPLTMRSSYLGNDRLPAVYEAAGGGRRADGWQPTSGGPNNALMGSLDTLRRRARDAVRQNLWADQALTKLTNNVVGEMVRPRTPYAELQRVWDDWADEADARNEVDFYGLANLAFRSMMEGGDCFVRFRPRRPEDGLVVPLQLQVLEAEHVPVTKNENVVNGNSIIGGVERDLLDRPVAFHMTRSHPSDTVSLITGTTNPLDTVRVPAEDVCHLKLVRRPGEARGEPWLTRALIKLRDLDAYDDAELMRKRTAALYGVILNTTGGNDDGAVATSESPDEDGVVVDPLEPGSIIVAPPGFEATVLAPADVGGNYDVFMRRQLGAIAVALGLTYEQLTQDWNGASDRTYRASMLEVDRMINSYRRLFRSQFLARVWKRFVDTAILSGAWTPPAGVSDRDLYAVAWSFPARGHIHPVQEVRAYADAISAGILDRASAAAELGRDVAEIDVANARDKARAQELGLNYSVYQPADSRGPAGDDVAALEAEDLSEQVGKLQVAERD
jgi:lambda family phage portal protein